MGWEGPVTHRQFIAWMEYLNSEEGTRPTLLYYYLMQIACEVRRVLAKKPAEIKLEDFELKFSPVKLDTRTPEQKAAEAKSVWKARLGM